MKKLNIILAFTASALFLAIVFTSFDFSNNFQSLSGNIQTNITEDPTKDKVQRNVSYFERIQKGDKLFENGYASLAIKEYTLASKMDETKAEPYIKIGKVHLKENEIEKASENFQIALKLEANNLEAKINSGKTLMKRKEFEKAKELFDAIQEENQTVQYYQGMFAAISNDRERATQLFTKAIEMNTTEEMTQNAQKFLKSIETYESTEGTSDTYFLALIAKACNDSEEFELAQNISEKVLKEKEEYRDVWILLGYACLKQESYDCSLDAFTRALELDPEKAETQYFLGLTYFALNRLEEAEKALETAIENGFKPLLQAKQKLAEIYLYDKKYTLAAQYYEGVLKEDPKNVDNFVRPVWIYLEQIFDPKKALKLAEKAVEENPESAMAYNLLGWAHVANGNLEKAEKFLQKALELDSELAAAYLNLGKLREAEGKPEEAKMYYKTAYEKGKGDSVSDLAKKKYSEL